MSVPNSEYRFEVAISFAGDNKRDHVRAVAALLREELGDGKVFFDEWFEAELAGPDAQIVLQGYYGKASRLVVACVCQRYTEKPWTQEEWRVIQAFERDLRDAGTNNSARMRFLPLRFGDAEVDGIYSTALVPDVRERTPEAISGLILDRLSLIKTASASSTHQRFVDTATPPKSVESIEPATTPKAVSEFIRAIQGKAPPELSVFEEQATQITGKPSAYCRTNGLPQFPAHYVPWTDTANSHSGVHERSGLSCAHRGFR